MLFSKKIIYLSVGIIAFSFNLLAQNFSDGFNFNLPARDTSRVKFLPEFPANIITNQDFVSISPDGHFSAHGRPLRFWGANLVADAAFPDNYKAWFIAGRLRKMGFNLIRFHHMDNPWGQSLFAAMSDTRHLNPAVLDKLDYLISELKKNGIYANINLNVSRTFKSSDGVPDADSLKDYAKGVTIFDPQLISLQKEFAQQLLTHRNPYTQLPLISDPVMALVEITNENSLYKLWRDNKLKHFSDGGNLTYRHNKMLDSLWNKFLIDKYLTTDNLSKNWNLGTATGSFNNLILNPGFEILPISTYWYLELNDPLAQAQMSIDTNNPYEGNASAKINVTSVSGTDWHIQFEQRYFTVKKDSLYTVEFAARSDADRTINLTIMRNNSPYTYYAGQDFNITTQWKVFTFTFKAPEDNALQGRLSFNFKNSKGSFWFDNVKLGSASVKGLLAGESLENKTVKRTDYSNAFQFTDLRIKDQSEFYIKLSDDFYREMTNFLKNTLMVKVPIVGNNWNFGPGDLISQSKFDYLDNHAYWQHPDFPNTPWSSTDWYIPNTPMVKASDGGTMSNLFAGIAYSGKPYTVSEYNHPFPNRYQTEMMLFSTAYLSFHDADGIEFFEYNGGNDFESDAIPPSGYFSINRNAALMSLSPSCAFAFRRGLVSKAEETIKIKYKPETVYMLPKNDRGNWQGINFIPNGLPFIHSVKNETFTGDLSTDFSALPAVPSGPYRSDTDEITWNYQSGILSVSAPAFCGITGLFNSSIPVKTSQMEIIQANDFGTLTWVSLKGDSLSKAERSLITISSKLQNTGMIWDGTATIHNNWGHSPTQIYPLNLTLRLFIQSDSIGIYPLDTFGNEDQSKRRIVYPVSPGIFEVKFDQNIDKTLWYGLEAFSLKQTPVETLSSGISSFSLSQNYPNPFNGSTLISYTVPCESHINITIFDPLGRKVVTLFDQAQPSGRFTQRWNGKDANNQDVKSGIYLVRLSSGKYSETRKLLLLK